MSLKEREQLQAELSILSKLHHPNIVEYIERDHRKDTQDLHLYMEYCGNGDLGQVIKKLKAKSQYAEEEFVWSVFAQLVTALYRCHYGEDPPEAGKNVMGLGNTAKPTKIRAKAVPWMVLHRDIKPENGALNGFRVRQSCHADFLVFLDEHNAVKLGDFGLSKILQSHDFASTYVGTPYYMSPEICAAERYSLYSDIWSLGCLLYELCAKEPPFNARTHIELFHKIKAGRVSPIPPVYSSELQKVITSCLQVNPNARPSTADLLNLSVVKLMRKEQEVVLFGQRMTKERSVLERKMKELEDRIKSMDEQKANMRAEIDAQVRREWEVKARLEIDRQVQAQTAQLKSLFDAEVHKRVQEQLASNNLPPRSSTPTIDVSEPAPNDVPLPLTDHESSDFPSQTDLSSLSLDSPTNKKQQPVKRSTRTPFARARTMFAAGAAAPSPIDVHMADPSPMSIACLSLSPRKNGKGAPNAKPKGNIFAAAEERWAPTNASTLPSPTISEDEDSGADGEDEEDDGLPALPSPTRDPFKAAAKTKRPSLGRVKTLPGNSKRLTSTPNLFAPNNKGANANVRRPASAVPVVATSPNRKGNTSPTRPRPNIVSKVPVSSGEAGSPRKGAASGEGMLKTAMRNQLQGRTLVELAQARTAPVSTSAEKEALKPTSKSDGAIKVTVNITENEVPVWDPERDEMPSPFLVRTKAPVMRSR
jgi:NIMA (never in mitosis gene a)-related kinase